MDSQIDPIATETQRRLNLAEQEIARLNEQSRELKRQLGLLQGHGNIEPLSRITAWKRTESPKVAAGTAFAAGAQATFVGVGQKLLANGTITFSKVGEYIEINGGGQALYDYVVDSAGGGTHTSVRSMITTFLADVAANGDITRTCWLKTNDTDTNIDLGTSGTTPQGTLVIDGAGAPQFGAGAQRERASLILGASPSDQDAYFKSSNHRWPNLVLRNIGIKMSSGVATTFFINITGSSGFTHPQFVFENVYFQTDSNSGLVNDAQIAGAAGYNLYLIGCAGTLNHVTAGLGNNALYMENCVMTLAALGGANECIKPLTIHGGELTFTSHGFNPSNGNGYSNYEIADTDIYYSGSGTCFTNGTDTQIGTRRIVLQNIRYYQSNSSAKFGTFGGSTNATSMIAVDGLWLHNTSGTTATGPALTINGFFDQVSVGIVSGWDWTTLTSYTSTNVSTPIDHGLLSGLADDDHTEYLLADGTRALTADWAPGEFTIGNHDFITSTFDLSVYDADFVIGRGGTYTPSNHGYTSIGGTALGFNDKDQALKVTLSAGTYTSISAYCKVDVNRTTTCALYDGSKNLVARTNGVGLTGTAGWYTFAFATSQVLTAGDYYLAFEGSSSFRTFTIFYDNTGASGDSYTNATYQSNPLSGGADDTKKLSIYITGTVVGHEPRIEFDKTNGHYLQYDRTNSKFSWSISSTALMELDASGARVLDYLRVGSLSAPTNTTAGDLTATRVFVNNDSNFSLQGTTNPQFLMDSGDFLQYTRSTNAFGLFINSVAEINYVTGGALQVLPSGVASSSASVQFAQRATFGYDGPNGAAYIVAAGGKSFYLDVNSTTSAFTIDSSGNAAFPVTLAVATTHTSGEIGTFGGTRSDIASGAKSFYHFSPIVAPASASASEFRTFYSDLIVSDSGGTITTIEAMNLDIRDRNSLTKTNYIGVTASVIIDSSSPATVGTLTNFTAFSTNYAGRGSGTPVMTITNAFGFASSPALSGITIGTLTDFDINDATGGAITTRIGLDIAKLTRATTNIGIRNAASTVWTPSTAQSIAAAATAITVTATVAQVQNTSGGSLTLTAAPTIADGQDGQIVRIVNVGTQNIVLQDQGTLASSNLRLTAASITLAPRNSVELMYSSTVGDWVQVGNVVAVL